MEKKKIFYITTPIYYVNDKPHIGHAYCTLLADVLNRYHKLFGYEGYMLTGVDEHGQKVQSAAEKRGIHPSLHCDEMQTHFKNLWRELNIEYDDFIRTSEERHKKVVQKLLQRLWEKGDIYIGEYEGWYSPTVEKFFADEEIKDGKCPETGKEVFKLKEKNYFFRMSKYQEKLIKHIEENPLFIRPPSRRNEVLGFLKKKLMDLCISRPKERLFWGIPIPFDENYVTYVWFDALINYITGAGIFIDDEKFLRLWSNAHHLIGKDILTTHSVYWPTMLMAMDLPLPKSIIATGWWLIDNTKMSKSFGNVINPLSLKDKYGVDPLRYFLLREMAIGLDSNFSEISLLQRNNFDLANDFGNLFSRSVQFILKNLGDCVPQRGEDEGRDIEIIEFAISLPHKIREQVENLNTHSAIEETFNFIRRLNKYMDGESPFKVLKRDRKRAEAISYNLLEGIRFAAVCLYPVIPETAKRILKDIGDDRGIIEFSKLKWGDLKSGNKITFNKHPFPRYDLKLEGIDEGKKEYIDINLFQKLDIRVGTIKEVSEVEGASKLIKIVVDCGDKGLRSIVAGIREFYSSEELIGKKIIVLVNLEHRKVRGILSEGMLLAATNDDKLSLLTVDKDINEGSKIS